MTLKASRRFEAKLHWELGIRNALANSAVVVDRVVVGRPLRHELVRMRAAHPEERVGRGQQQ
jgi:hypothetical protein